MALLDGFGVCFAPDGRGKVAVLEGHANRAVALAFSADGRFLVSGSADTSARVWDVARDGK
jgi:WD40 repeat protein